MEKGILDGRKVLSLRLEHDRRLFHLLKSLRTYNREASGCGGHVKAAMIQDGLIELSTSSLNACLEISPAAFDVTRQAGRAAAECDVGTPAKIPTVMLSSSTSKNIRLPTTQISLRI